MSLIVWNDNLSVKISEIDTQHKKLVDIINHLHTLMIERKSKDLLKKIIDDLLNYTTTHFATEEKYFDTYNYPDTLNHKNQHKQFVKKVTEFQDGLKTGKVLLSLDIMNFLKDWLINHIKGTDKKYSSFFNENGLK